MLRSGRKAAAGLATAALAAAAAGAAVPNAAAHSATAPNGLRYSTASNRVVQRQPAAGSCRARGRGLSSRPDRRCTPGALNPAVTQATIGRTICRSGWTESVRPAESITEPEKYASMAAYGDTGSASGYEYDHFIPLELGGATNAPHNLWPEPGASPNRKDRVEDYLNGQVCDRRMTLARAQKLIAGDWVTIYHQITRAHPQAPTAGASCSAAAVWNATYGDYDVYVHSNQPDSEARVSGAGASASYRTNSSGYADVYFHASKAAAGETVTVTVGAATCQAAL